MDFFRKNQGLILVLGVILLVIFSISGPILDTARNWFTPSRPLPSIQVKGRRVELTPEDYEMSSLVRRMVMGDSVYNVLPNLNQPGDRGSEDTPDVLAALRRIAIEYGIEASYDDADRVIEGALAAMNRDRPDDQQFDADALGGGRGSALTVRTAIFEGLRIATLVRSLGFSVDTSEAALLQQIADEIEKVEIEGVFISEADFEDTIRESFDAMDEAAQGETLIAYLDDLDPGPRRPFEDVNRHDVEFFGFNFEGAEDRQAIVARLAELDLIDLGETELESWEDSITDDQVEVFVTRTRRYLYRKPEPVGDGEEGDGGEGSEGESGEGETSEGDATEGETTEGETAEGETTAGETTAGEGDAESQDDEVDQKPAEEEFIEPEGADVRFRMVLEEAMRSLRDKIEDELEAHIEAQARTLDEILSRLSVAELDRDEAFVNLDKVREESGLGTDEYKAAKDVCDETVDVITAGEDELKAARYGILQSFDLAEAWSRLTEGLSNAVTIRTEEQLPQDDLKEFEPIGGWELASTVELLSHDRQPVGSTVFHSKSHVFGVRLMDRTEKPLQDLEDIRDDAVDSYVASEAKQMVEENVEAFEERVEELARAAAAEKIAEVEGGKDAKVDERYQEWLTEKESERSELQAALDALPAGAARQAVQRFESLIADLDEELAEKDERREDYAEIVQEEIDEEVDELVSERTDEVFANAAAAEGIELKRTGALPSDLRLDGRNQWTYDSFVRSVFFSQAIQSLEKVGDITDGFVPYSPDKAQVWARVVAEEDGTVDDVNLYRMRARRNLVDARLRSIYWQSFSKDSLIANFGFEDPREESGATAGPEN